MNRIRIFLFLCFVLLFSCEKNIDWNVYGGSYKRTQFVNSEKLNLNNISNLKKVWEYSSADNANFSQIQTNPLIINVWINGSSLVATSGFTSYQWYNSSGIPITGDTTEVFNPTSSDGYYVVVTDTNN